MPKAPAIAGKSHPTRQTSGIRPNLTGRSACLACLFFAVHLREVRRVRIVSKGILVIRTSTV
ncbi:hypothetical protein BIFANG_02055 [Bifidobacterium angulatum DSM 20098 = JCM 7096]|uniref:Uncharacterized protein n=1 Tax=Bifidobacterium angulatum DSM 20098 = JCM 7096 TaxID=518635 RepID=C4FCM9_9BIFI|nr:hypothetical protein BIFANG_02055 [Bifidobacterium angulatum DSM 20098 = JCM 7096]